MDLSIELVENEWAVDSKIDLTRLNQTSADTYETLNKYHKYLNTAKKYRRIFEAEKKRMIHWRTDYYLGNLPKDFLDEKGWKPNRIKILKTELDRYLDADELIIDINLSVGECNDIIDFCESIIKAIHNRSFTIGNIIDNKKFDNGGY